VNSRKENEMTVKKLIEILNRFDSSDEVRLYNAGFTNLLSNEIISLERGFVHGDGRMVYNQVRDDSRDVVFIEYGGEPLLGETIRNKKRYLDAVTKELEMLEENK
jgi:hypothetical protein